MRAPAILRSAGCSAGFCWASRQLEEPMTTRKQPTLAIDTLCGAAVLTLVAIFLSACDGPPPPHAAASPENDVYTIALTAPTIGGLPKCTSALSGTTAYVQSPPSLYSCIAGTWVPIPCLTVAGGAVAYSSATQTLLACVSGQWTPI